MEQITALDYKIQEMASRIKELRELEGLTTAEMALKTDVSEAEYIECESGKSDLNFAFIYRCALALSVNVTDIIEGYSPKLAGYTVTRAGGGQKVSQAHGMTYYNLAYAFRDRIAEPLFVKSIENEHNVHNARYNIQRKTHKERECGDNMTSNQVQNTGQNGFKLLEGNAIALTVATNSHARLQQTRQHQ